MCIILNAVLVSGLKMAQAVHVFRAFLGEYPTLESDWHANDNNVVVLQHEDLSSLQDWLEKRGFKVSGFREPDLDDALTGICVEPRARRHLGHLPLAT